MTALFVWSATYGYLYTEEHSDIESLLFCYYYQQEIYCLINKRLKELGGRTGGEPPSPLPHCVPRTALY